MDIFGIRAVPTAAYGRIAKKRNVMAPMRGIDRGGQARLFGDQTGDCEASDLRNNIVKKLIAVA